ncbi:serine aminopeptidase domain-containing protein [Frankia sp. AvcI1]|uniref:serine aminopeptidase domain-containing protein n=1 Tax=Frankia sp. AvcI1 TaxID=573496 RepID=UPI0021190A71|nr:alpha/beta hydrolase [Frankia sp. AvcI1]
MAAGALRLQRPKRSTPQSFPTGRTSDSSVGIAPDLPGCNPSSSQFRLAGDDPFASSDEDAGRRLADDGYLEHSPTFRLGRPLLNEVFYLRPDRELGAVTAPTLIVHGTKDTFVPVDSSRAAVDRFGGEVRLVAVDGAQHGIAVHDDPAYADPQTQIWQESVIRTVADWAGAQLRAEDWPSP